MTASVCGCLLVPTPQRGQAAKSQKRTQRQEGHSEQSAKRGSGWQEGHSASAAAGATCRSSVGRTKLVQQCHPTETTLIGLLASSSFCDQSLARFCLLCSALQWLVISVLCLASSGTSVQFLPGARTSCAELCLLNAEVNLRKSHTPLLHGWHHGGCSRAARLSWLDSSSEETKLSMRQQTCHCLRLTGGKVLHQHGRKLCKSATASCNPGTRLLAV